MKNTPTYSRETKITEMQASSLHERKFGLPHTVLQRQSRRCEFDHG